MTNEELVILIQQGNADSIIELWEQTKRFISIRAEAYLNNSTFSFDFLPDLEQAGYFALIDAAETYDPDKGASFIHYLTFHLKNNFREALGIRSDRQSRDPLHNASSLDMPIKNSKSDDSFLISDIYGSEDLAYEDVEEKVYREELRGLLQNEIDLLPDKEARAIEMHYWQGMTYQEIADVEGTSLEQIRQRNATGIR